MTGPMLRGVISLSLLSCGGNAAAGGPGSTTGLGGGTCNTVAPCGGSIVGTWTIVSECVSGSASQTDSTGCTTTSTLSVDSVSGAITFNPDGTYTTTASLSEALLTTYSAVCLSAGTTCDALAASLSGAGTSGANCTPLSGGCSCAVPIAIQNMSAAGTYTTSGTTFTSAADSSTPTSSSYCVSGAQLDIIGMALSTTTGSTGSDSADLVLRRD